MTRRVESICLLFIGVLLLAVIGFQGMEARRIEEKIVETIVEENKVVEVIENKNIARMVEMTAYSGKHGTITASNTKVRPGIVAVSRDLFDQGYVFGKKVYIHGLGIYEIADLMNKRFINRIDVFIGSDEEAKTFGISQAKVSLLEM